MNIAAYCRVSTDKEDQLNSLEAQKEFFSEYTKRTGDNLIRLYADEGISGVKIKNRKEFLRMLSDAEHGLFDMVVVKDISRFARNTVDLLQSVRKLKALGIETQFLTANMTSMGNSEFVLTIFGALAQEESANTSKRVKFGKKLNAEKGRVPNIVYGYDKTISSAMSAAGPFGGLSAPTRTPMSALLFQPDPRPVRLATCFVTDDKTAISRYLL
jgi:DNA invertase Pin-like site-specific DNA recombinase